jgi:hypothetical protein
MFWRMSVLSAACLSTALVVAAQTTPQSPQPPAAPRTVGARIEGLVLEPGINQPVPGASVMLNFLGEQRPQIIGGPMLQQVTAKTATDANGAFSFPLDKLGYYIVRWEKDGYSAAGQGPGPPTSSENVTLTADEPTRNLKLFLSRPAQLSGRVVDDETGDPVPNLRLAASRRSNFAGRYLMLATAGATLGTAGSANAAGEFHISKLTPGDYVVKIGPQKDQKSRILTTFTEKDIAAIDTDYATTFWPGGAGEQSALPVSLASGATVNIGRISARKIPYYRVLVHLKNLSCAPGDKVGVFEYHEDYQFARYTMDIADAPCGQDLLVTGFAPGSYRLLFAGKQKDPAVRDLASVPFVIGHENVEITASFQRPVSIDGKIIVPQETKLPDVSAMTVRLDSFGGIPFADMAMPPKLDSTGAFRVAVFPVETHRIETYGVPSGYYVKEFRYNGARIDGDMLTLQPGAIVNSLNIVLDDKPAAIAGFVTRGDKPVANPYIVVAKWPLPSGRVFIATASTTGNEKGSFQFTALAPGEYRVVAMESQSAFFARGPGVLEDALARSKKVELTDRALQTLTLELTDLH